MSKPSEHKTVQARIQARILAYAQEIGWTLVLRAEGGSGAAAGKGARTFQSGFWFGRRGRHGLENPCPLVALLW